MGQFEYISHTADKGFRVEAQSLEDIFETAVKGLAALLREDFLSSPQDVELSESEAIDIEAGDVTWLLVDFLSEILTLSHINKTVYLKADISKLSEQKIEAAVYGRRVEYFDEDIKAITYHQADVRENHEGRYETIIVVDI